MKYFDNIKHLAELKEKYRHLAKQLHPDKGGDAKQFREMKAEYDILLKDFKDGKSRKTKRAKQEPDFDFREILKVVLKTEAARRKIKNVSYEKDYEVYIVDVNELIDKIF